MDIERLQYLTRMLSGIRTLRELRHSEFYARCRGEIDSVLDEPHVVSGDGERAGATTHIRVAQWNIEKGRQLGRIIEVLRSDPILSMADILLLNEADRGMNRWRKCFATNVNKPQKEQAARFKEFVERHMMQQFFKTY